MIKKEIWSEEIVVKQPYRDFNEVCYTAMQIALDDAGIDADGHSTKIDDWVRSCCHLKVEFVSLEMTVSMVGLQNYYKFKATAIKTVDEEETSLEKHSITHDIESNNGTLCGPGFTPDSSLPPIGGDDRRDIYIRVSVPSDWEHRLDMQWVLEREIMADRWSWWEI